VESVGGLITRAEEEPADALKLDYMTDAKLKSPADPSGRVLVKRKEKKGLRGTQLFAGVQGSKQRARRAGKRRKSGAALEGSRKTSVEANLGNGYLVP